MGNRQPRRMASPPRPNKPRNPRPLMTTSSQPDNSIAARMEAAGGQMTFFEHLAELRKRIINSLYAIGVGAFIGVYVAKYVINWVTAPIIKALSDAHLNPHLFYTHPAGY